MDLKLMLLHWSVFPKFFLDVLTLDPKHQIRGKLEVRFLTDVGRLVRELGENNPDVNCYVKNNCRQNGTPRMYVIHQWTEP